MMQRRMRKKKMIEEEEEEDRRSEEKNEAEFRIEFKNNARLLLCCRGEGIFNGSSLDEH